MLFLFFCLLFFEFGSFGTATSAVGPPRSTRESDHAPGSPGINQDPVSEGGAQTIQNLSSGPGITQDFKTIPGLGPTRTTQDPNAEPGSPGINQETTPRSSLITQDPNPGPEQPRIYQDQTHGSEPPQASRDSIARPGSPGTNGNSIPSGSIPRPPEISQRSIVESGQPGATQVSSTVSGPPRIIQDSSAGTDRLRTKRDSAPVGPAQGPSSGSSQITQDPHRGSGTTQYPNSKSGLSNTSTDPTPGQGSPRTTQDIVPIPLRSETLQDSSVGASPLRTKRDTSPAGTAQGPRSESSQTTQNPTSKSEPPKTSTDPTPGQGSGSSRTTRDPVPKSGLPGTSPNSTPGPRTTTQDPTCKRECPDGYLIGRSSCFILYPSSRTPSYQSSLSLCMSKNRQTLASLEKIRDDIPLLQSSASEKGVNWIYANGLGSKKERFEKRADVYSIYEQSIVYSPIATTVKISDKYSNISTLCILPKYCNSPICDIEQLLLTFDYNLLFNSSSKSLKPKETAHLTCLYTRQNYEITCGSLGNIYPDPSMIDCKRTSFEQLRELSLLSDTTNQLVSSCSKGFKRGVESCDPVTDSNGTLLGYRLNCKKGFTMSTCWYTPDTCTPGYCGKHGRCISEVDERRCECDYGYSGDRCEFNLREKYSKVWTFPVFTGAIIALGGFIVRFVKKAVALGRMDMKQDEDDPQSTHQTLRSYCMFVAGILVLFSSNPSLTDISPTACRFNFIAVHFCFLLAMVQWLLEGWNVNQIIRCVHLNEWETDWNGDRTWGVRIAPRMIVSVLVVASALLITFQAGWNQLAAPWTCVGVFRQETISVWIPIFGMVICVFLFAGAVCESSLLIKFRRPLLGYRMDLRIERDLGHVAGRRVEKCRRNEVLCMVGLILLVILWLMTILSADYKDDVAIGSLTVIMSLVYSIFSFYQEVQTCPEDRAMWITLLQRYLPKRFAPSYNPENMWTTEEVREMYGLPKEERKIKYQEYITRNQYLHLHHRWDIRFNEILEENETTINEALVKVFCEEMNRLKEHNGTILQKYYIQDAYKDFLSSIPDIDPRTENGRQKGRLELVTLAAEAPIGVKLAKFFIVPGFDIFEPEIPNDGNDEMNRNERQHRRLLNERIRMEDYKIMREEAHSQTVFINSSIHFQYFGNEVVR